MHNTPVGTCELPPDIVMTASFWHELQAHLLRPVKSRFSSPDEQLAFILASSNTSSHRRRLLAREMLKAGPADLLEQRPAAIKPRPEFVVRALNRCRVENLHLIEVHSHPFSYGDGTTFSGIDWHADEGKMPGLSALVPEMIHVTMVMGRDSLDAHYYDRAARKIFPVRQVVVVGTDPDSTVKEPVLRYLSPVGATGYNRSNGTAAITAEEYTGLDVGERYQRQEMVFGRQTQRRMRQSRVAVVGLGGLGSFVAQELAHLGVGHLILIDSDTVEETNLNRLLGAGMADIGKPKVAVYERLIRDIAPATTVDALAVPILDEEALALAKSADILVGCVDSHGARQILNQLAVRYMIPLVDGGSAFKRVKNDDPLAPGGQVQVVVPGMGCLECRGFINSRRAAFDLAPRHLQEEERTHGYGTTETAPAVIFLNGVIASAQVAEVVFLLAGSYVNLPVPVPPMSLYRAYQREMMAVAFHASPNCPTCGEDGVVAVGDLAPVRHADTVVSAAAPALSIPSNAAVATKPRPDAQHTDEAGVSDASGTSDALVADAQETVIEAIADVTEPETIIEPDADVQETTGEPGVDTVDAMDTDMVVPETTDEPKTADTSVVNTPKRGWKAFWHGTGAFFGRIFMHKRS